MVEKPIDFGLKITSYLVRAEFRDRDNQLLSSTEDKIAADSSESHSGNINIDTVCLKIKPTVSTRFIDLHISAVNSDGISDKAFVSSV